MKVPPEAACVHCKPEASSDCSSGQKLVKAALNASARIDSDFARAPPAPLEKETLLWHTTCKG